MQFIEKNKPLNDWRFNGVCEDEKTGKFYMFCTNSILEFNHFKDKGVMLGMKFVNGKYNENYEVVRKLIKK